METKLFDVGEVKFASTDDETMTFTGYGAVFGNTDDKGDVIEPGAFANTLKSGEPVLMFLNHDHRSLPVGKWLALEEDSFGLKVTGQFIDTAMGRDVYTAAKAGAITGLSIGFIPVDVTKARGTVPRSIKSVNLLEVSVVTIPANTKARIADVKSLTTEDTFEYELIKLGMHPDEVKSFLGAYRESIEAKYNEAAVNVAAHNLLSKLQGEK